MELLFRCSINLIRMGEVLSSKNILLFPNSSSIDMWSPYKGLVEELMPNANITADRFHVMKQVNIVLIT